MGSQYENGLNEVVDAHLQYIRVNHWLLSHNHAHLDEVVMFIIRVTLVLIVLVAPITRSR